MFFHAGPVYQYTGDLLALDRCRAPHFQLPSTRFASIVTPQEWRRWQHALSSHPDKMYVSYIVQGFRCGFRIGFQCGSVCCLPAKRNMPSAAQSEEKIAEFLAAECAAGRVLGPFSRDLVPTVHITVWVQYQRVLQENTGSLLTYLTLQTIV